MCYMLVNFEENFEESIRNELFSFIRSVYLQSYGWLCILFFLCSNNSMKVLIDIERVEEERKYVNIFEKFLRFRIYYLLLYVK